MGFVVGFLPLALLAAYRQSEYLLWSALTAYMAVLLVFLTYRLLKVHRLLLADEEADVSLTTVSTAL